MRENRILKILNPKEVRKKKKKKGNKKYVDK